MKCECCKKKEAEIKDFRTSDGVTSKYRVCKECFNLDDKNFWETYNKK